MDCVVRKDDMEDVEHDEDDEREWDGEGALDGGAERQWNGPYKPSGVAGDSLGISFSLWMTLNRRFFLQE